MLSYWGLFGSYANTEDSVCQIWHTNHRFATTVVDPESAGRQFSTVSWVMHALQVQAPTDFAARQTALEIETGSPLETELIWLLPRITRQRFLQGMIWTQLFIEDSGSSAMSQPHYAATSTQPALLLLALSGHGGQGKSKNMKLKLPAILRVI